MEVPISFITVIDEAGSPIAVYPKVDIGNLLGAVVTAISGALSVVGAQTIENISTDQFRMYLKKTDKELLILLAIRKDVGEVKEDLINWFLFNLAREIDDLYQKNQLDILVVDENRGSPLHRLLEEYYDSFARIESALKRFMELYSVAYKVLGDIAKRIVETNIDRLRLPLRVEVEGVYFRQVKSDLDEVADSLVELTSIFKKRVKELT